MSANPMQRKVRNSFLLGILVMLIIAIIIGVIVFFLVLKPNTKNEEQSMYAHVYRLKDGISVESGHKITEDMVESVKIPVTKNNDFVIAKIENDKKQLIDVFFEEGYTRIDLESCTILTNSMIYNEDVTDSMRYMEYNMITIPTMLEVDDYIDIRLRLPNSQDLIVISHKQIKSLYGQTIGLHLTEEEILILNSAIVESYIIPSSELYIAKYVEGGEQDAAEHTYVPTEQVITLMNMDKNIVATAKEELGKLYNREYDLNGDRQPDTTLGATIRGGISGQYTSEANYNVQAGMQEQIQAARKAREDYLSELEGY